MKIRLMIFIFFFFCAVLFATPAIAEGTKFVRSYRDNNYDMYVNKMNIIQNQGMISFWVKCVYSEQGKALVIKELPKKHQKAPIQYGLDYFMLDTKKSKYSIKLASVYTSEKEIYREGSKKWLSVRDGTIGAVLISEVTNFLSE